jgi:hypothetical protein
VFALKPSAQMSANEIAAAALADQGGTFNPQQQFPVTWPDHPVVALAYLDQLQRSGAVTAAGSAGLREALGQVTARLNARQKDPALAARIDGLAAMQLASADAASAARAAALRKTLRGIVAQLR